MKGFAVSASFHKLDPGLVLVLHKGPGPSHTLTVTGLELAAVMEAQIGQQLAHGSTPNPVEQSDPGAHALHDVAVEQS